MNLNDMVLQLEQEADSIPTAARLAADKLIQASNLVHEAAEAAQALTTIDLAGMIAAVGEHESAATEPTGTAAASEEALEKRRAYQREWLRRKNARENGVPSEVSAEKATEAEAEAGTKQRKEPTRAQVEQRRRNCELMRERKALKAAQAKAAADHPDPSPNPVEVNGHADYHHGVVTDGSYERRPGTGYADKMRRSPF